MLSLRELWERHSDVSRSSCLVFSTAAVWAKQMDFSYMGDALSVHGKQLLGVLDCWPTGPCWSGALSLHAHRHARHTP
jgi:hypothetical protein